MLSLAAMAAHAPLKLDALAGASPRKATLVVFAVSAAALALLFAVIYGHGQGGASAAGVPAWVGWLPALNAALNATSAVFLVLAWRAIVRRDVRTHYRRILGALTASTLFLVSYLAYHAVQGETRFGGHGFVRPVYFFVLITHIVLSAAVLPLIGMSLFFSLSGRFPRHRVVAKVTLPVWLYVSVTGVVVFAMLRLFG